MAAGIHYAHGAFVGSSRAVTVGSEKVGFSPKAVRLYTIPGSGKGTVAFWTSEMGDGGAFKVVTSGAGSTDISQITSNGITPTASGFTVGTDGDLNPDGKTVYFEAWG